MKERFRQASQALKGMVWDYDCLYIAHHYPILLAAIYQQVSLA